MHSVVPILYDSLQPVHIFENGTVLMAYRGGWDPWHVGIAIADSWRGPFQRVSDDPVFPDINEDPGRCTLCNVFPCSS